MSVFTSGVQRRLISSKITVNVKLLSGQRRTVPIQVSIFDKVEKIHEMLLEVAPDEMKAYGTPRFVYPQGTMRTLNFEDTIEKVQLRSNCKLVLMGIQSFSWDP